MLKSLAFAYGVGAYLLFFGTILYLIGFVESIGVPKNINSGATVPAAEAAIVDVLLIALFGITHSVMARPSFKRVWTRIVPEAIERSTFVIVASLCLCLLFWQWRPITTPVWAITEPAAIWAIQGISVVGFVLVFWSSFLIDHFDLFGLRQVFLHLKSQPYTYKPFAIRSLYRFVRHPLMLGFLIAFWFTPHMTSGHLLFATAMTAYIFVGIKFEERNLVDAFGDRYENYRRTTPMILPVRKPISEESFVDSQ